MSADPAQVLPARLIQRDLLEIVGELTRLDGRLSRLLSAIDLPPRDESEQVERRRTLELCLQCAISIQQGTLRRAAEDFRRVAMKRPEEYPAASTVADPPAAAGGE